MQRREALTAIAATPLLRPRERPILDAVRFRVAFRITLVRQFRRGVIDRDEYLKYSALARSRKRILDGVTPMEHVRRACIGKMTEQGIVPETLVNLWNNLVKWLEANWAEVAKVLVFLVTLLLGGNDEEDVQN